MNNNAMVSKISALAGQYGNIIDKIVVFGDFATDDVTDDSVIDLYIRSSLPDINAMHNDAEYIQFESELYEILNSVRYGLLISGTGDVPKSMRIWNKIQNNGIIIYNSQEG